MLISKSSCRFAAELSILEVPLLRVRVCLHAQGWSEEQVKEWCLCLHSAGLIPTAYDGEMAEAADSLAMFDGAMILEIGACCPSSSVLP